MMTNKSDNPREKLYRKVLHGRWVKIVSAMASVVVFVTVYALILPAITLSNQAPKCNAEEHTHVAECYDAEGNVVCGTEEHVHNLACYSDLNAAIENEEYWVAELPELTGDRNADVIAVAKSQIGYKENNENYIVSDNEQTKGYTRYGHWYGDNVDTNAEKLGNGLSNYAYRDWDAMFVSFVLRYAEIYDLGFDSDAGNWAGALSDAAIYVDAADYIPQMGDLIFFTRNVEESMRVGIVSGVNRGLFGNEIKSISVILGDSDNEVQEVKVAVAEYTEGDVTFETIHGYGVLTPGYGETTEAPVAPETAESNTEVTAEEEVAPEETEIAEPVEEVVADAPETEETSVSIEENSNHLIGMAEENLDTTEEIQEGEVSVELIDAEVSQDGAAIVMNWNVSASLSEATLPAGAIIRIDTSSGKVHAMTVEQVLNWAQNAVIGTDNATYVDNEDFEITFIGDNGLLYSWDDVQSMDATAVTSFTGIHIKALNDITLTEDGTVAFGFSSTAKVADANAGQNYYVSKVSVNGTSNVATHTYENGKAQPVDQNIVLRDAGLEEQEEKTLVAKKDDYTVTMSYGPEAGIPDGSKLYVKEIKQGTVEYDKYIDETKALLGISEEDAAELLGRFFDIKIITKDGEFEPKAPVNVVIDYKKALETEDASYVNAVHFSEDGAEMLPVDTVDVSEPDNEMAMVKSVEFSAESFSVYGVIYTVDFATVDGISWSWPGEGSYSVASIMSEIGVSDPIKSVSLVREIDAGGSENALYLEEKEDGWYLTSGEAFEDTFKLTVKAGEKVHIITVTDAMTNPTTTGRTKLTPTTPNVTMTASLRSDVTYSESDEKYSADFKVDFVIQPSNIDVANGYYIELADVTIPDQFLDREYSAYDSAKDHKSFTYRYIKQDNGKYAILIDYDPEYVASFGPDEEVHDNYINFTAFIDKISDKGEEGSEIKITEEIPITVPDDKIDFPENESKSYQVGTEKSYSGYSIDTNDKIHVRYTTRISSTKGTQGTVTVNDVLSYNMSGSSGYSAEDGDPKVTSVSIVSFSKNGNSQTAPTVTADLSEAGKIGMSYEVPKMSAGDYYDVVYEYVYDKAYLKTPRPSEYSVTYNGNNVLALETGGLKDRDSSSYSIEKTNNPVTISKEGGYNKNEGVIDWTIKVSFNDDTPGNHRHQVIDEAFSSADFRQNSIQVYNSAGQEITNFSLIGNTLTLPAGSGDYTIKYKTEAESLPYKERIVSNTATGINGDTQKGTGPKDVHIPPSTIIQKTLDRNNISYTEGTDSEKGEYRDYTFTWHVIIPVPEEGFPAGTKINDKLEAYVWSVNNHKDENHTFTQEQQDAFMAHWKNYFGNDFNMSWSPGNRYEIVLNQAWTNPNNIQYIEFDYSTTGRLYMEGATVKLGTDSSGDSFTNTLQIDDATSNGPTWEYQKFLQKVSHGGTKAEMHRTDSDRTIVWDVILVLDDDYENLNVVDTLPAGLTLKNIAVGQQYACWDLFKSEEGSTHYEYKAANGDYYNGLDELQNWNQGGNVYKEGDDDGKIWGRSPTNGMVVTADQNGQEITVNINQVGEYRPKLFTKDSVLYVRITAQVNEDEFDPYNDITASYTNTASVSTGSTPLGEDSNEQTTTLLSDTLKKGELHGDFNDNSSEGGNHRLNYTIDINKDGHSLLDDPEGTLELEDVLTYQKNTDFDFTVMLVPDSVKLYEKVGSEWVEYVNPAEPMVYTFAETSDSTDSTIKIKTLSVKGIPDDKILQLRYSYDIEVTEPEKSKKYTIPKITNTSTLKGDVEVTSQTEVNEVWEEFSTQAGSVSSGNIRVVKVDSENYAVKLAGAKFRLDKYTATGWTQVDAIGRAEFVKTEGGMKIYVTNSNGVLNIIQPSTGTQFEEDVAYRVVEIEAPAGYNITDPAPTAFFFFSNTKTSAQLDHVPPDTYWYRADNLLLESDSMWIENVKTPELFITKSVKGDKTFDEVKDKVSFTVTGPEDFNETILLSDTGWTYDSEKEVYVYRINNGIQNNQTYNVTENITDFDGVKRETTYSVNSRPVEEGVAADVLVRYGTGTIDYVNTYGETEIKAKKIWNDNNNAAGKRPASVELRLYKDGDDMGDNYAKVLSDQNSWETTWDHLYSGPTYKVVETEVPGYSISYTVEDVNGGAVERTNESLTTGDTVTVTNSNVGLEVEKVWIGDNPPESITVQLDAKGPDTEDPKDQFKPYKGWNKEAESREILNASNNWKHEFTDLSARNTYRIVEVSNVPGYVTTYSTDNENLHKGDKIVITNTKETTGIAVKKLWDVEDSNDIKPVTVKLYEATASVSSDGVPVHVYYNNALYADWHIIPGTDIIFSGNDAEYGGLAFVVNDIPYDTSGRKVINITEETTIRITSDWGNIANTNIEKQEKMDVDKEHATVLDTVTLSDTNNWYKEWTTSTNPALTPGKYYYVEEVTEGYEVTYSENNEGIQTGTIIITNAKPQTGSLKLTKQVTINDIDLNDSTIAAKNALVNGDYTFVITGPTSAASQITKYVQININNGVKTYKVSDSNTTEAWADATSVTDDWAIVTDLPAGKYQIEEVTPSNGTKISQINGTSSSTYSTEVTVVAGDTEAAEAAVTFTNNINTGDLKIEKKVTGTTATDKDFEFEVTLQPPTGVNLASTYPAKKNGNATDPVSVTGNKISGIMLRANETFEILELPEGTIYEVKEKTPLPSGYYEGTHSNNSNVSITKNTEQTATMNNTYKAEGNIDFNAKKVFTNGTLGTPNFSFTLTQVQGENSEEAVTDSQALLLANNPVTKSTTATTGTEETVSFDSISVIKDSSRNQEGEYWFLLKEDVPSDVDQNNVKDGIKYDAAKYWIKVTVTDNGSGTLTVTKAPNPSDSNPDATFNNTKLKDFEFSKEWYTIENPVNPSDAWPDDKEITVTVHRRIGNTVDDDYSLQYTINKSDLENNKEIAGKNATDPKLVVTDATKFKFKLSNLDFSGSIGSTTGEYTYYVTEDQVPDYKEPEYRNGASTSTDGAINSGTIINRPVDATTLPETGGIGTSIYRLAGLITIVIAVIGIFINKRRERWCGGCESK